MIITATMVVLSIIFFYLVLALPTSWLIKFVLIAAAMYLVNLALAKKYKLSTEMGFLLLKSQAGLKFIDQIAKHKDFWNFFADVGTTMGYGVLGILIMRKNVNWKTFTVGIVLITLISFIIAPFSLAFLSQALGGAAFEKKATISFGDQQTTSLVVAGIMYLGGFFLMLVVGLLYYGFHIAYLFIQFIFFGSQQIITTQPGGTMLLPGVNLKFFEGILALAAILVVHEGSHAILSRIAGVPLKSTGIVLFGIIPIGAFVEPDEHVLNATKQKEQTRILVGGSTANFIFSILFFLAFVPVALLLKSLAPGFLHDGVLFVYYLFGYAFSINFVVATVNLLPLPLFDGYRILELNVKQKLIVNILMYLTLAAFIFNFLPWFFVR
ncbi:MAG: site-2 protease family protein [Candidatus Micrarchaeota archaeon]